MNTLRKLKRLFDINLYKSIKPYTLGYRSKILRVTFLSIITSLISIAIALITKSMIDYAVSGDLSRAVNYGLLFAVTLLAQIILTNYTSYYTVRVVESTKNELQRKLLQEIYSKKWLDINNYKSGDLLTRIYADITNITTAVFSTIPSLISLLLQLVVAFIILAFYDPMLAFLTFLITPMTVLISMLIGRKLKHVQHAIQGADSTQRSLINESLNNLLILKSYNYLNSNLEEIHDLQDKRFELIKYKNNITIKANIMLSLGSRIGFFFALAFGAYRLASQSITFGIFTAFLQLVGQIQGPIQIMARQLPQLIASISSIERLNEINALPNDTYTLSNNISRPMAIHIDNITFGYSQDKLIFDGFSLEIKKGEKVAILGPSGKGKTTLLHLLLNLIEPSKGSISMTLDDGSRHMISSNDRSHYAYVPQTNTLFSGSIRSNLLIKDHVSEEAIQRAIKVSCADTFINDLPDGIDTILHERGVGLSQGQAQRISIARAILHDAPILLFDEVTSALDSDTEAQLIENIHTYYPDKTLIAVTHREGILDICDHVLRV